MNKELNEKQYFDTKAVQDYINSHIELYADSVKVEGIIKKTDIEMINNRQFAVIHLNYELEQKPQKLILDYNMFLDDSDPSHANYATIKLNGKQQEAILTYESRELEIGVFTFLSHDTVSNAWFTAYFHRL